MSDRIFRTLRVAMMAVLGVRDKDPVPTEDAINDDVKTLLHQTWFWPGCKRESGGRYVNISMHSACREIREGETRWVVLDVAFEFSTLRPQQAVNDWSSMFFYLRKRMCSTAMPMKIYLQPDGKVELHGLALGEYDIFTELPPQSNEGRAA